MTAYIEAGRVLAASSREAEVRVVTENTGDFSRIQRQLRGFRFSAADELLNAPA